MRYEVSTDTSENYTTMENIIQDMGWSGTDVLNYLTDYHGLQLLDEGFMQNLIDCEL